MDQFRDPPSGRAGILIPMTGGNASRIFVVIGVSGCGKSTVAAELARLTGGVMLEGDDFHTPRNKEKMASGIPLEDDDRAEWLDKLNWELKSRYHSPRSTFLACSALRTAHRDRLARGLTGLRFIHLRGSRECILGRLEKRKDHFMPPSLLESQFATLEEPDDAMSVTVERPVAEVVEEILGKLTERVCPPSAGFPLLIGRERAGEG